MTRIVCCFVALSAAVCAGPAAAQTSVGDTPYFPAAEGTTWTYRVADGKVTVKVSKHEKQDGKMTARFETLTADVVAVQHIAVTDNLVTRVVHNGEKVTPPLTLLQLPLAKGQSWNVDSKITGRSGDDEIKGKATTDEEDVKVPAGEYKKAIRVTAELRINGFPARITTWYAEKVGMVKQRVEMDSNDHEMVLEKIELPK
jgi:hypothetical protein